RPCGARGNAGRRFGACFGVAVRCGACAGVGAGRRFCDGARFFEGGAGARRVDAGRFDAVIGSTCCCARHCTQRRVADTGRQRTGRRQPRRRIGAVGRQRAWRALSGPAESRRLAGPHRGRTLPPGHSSDGRRCVAVRRARP
ncbi:hypothetical protein, partial [Burkholderia multivorans]|uniref:hypothetical protein n=1 Tax=Burkholderia multivorans TaxID=87883 RepID=UPI0028707414